MHGKLYFAVSHIDGSRFHCLTMDKCMMLTLHTFIISEVLQNVVVKHLTIKFNDALYRYTLIICTHVAVC